MKTTPLEKLIKADLILQVQQQYSRSLCKRSDKLVHRAQEFQKRLEDGIRMQDLKMAMIIGKNFGQWFPIFKAKSRYEITIQYINKKIGNYEQMAERHDKWTEDLKRILNMKNKYYKKNELKTLLVDEMPASFNASSIPHVLETVTYWKNTLYTFNREWMSILKSEEDFLRVFEQMEDKMEYDNHQPELMNSEHS